jgi:hypothetical protein
MIEINLIEQKKVFKAPTVLGVDLGQLNFKMLIFSFALYYVPDLFLKDYFEQERMSFTTQLEELNGKLKKIENDLKGNENIRERLDAFNKQIEKLRERSQQVDSIVQERTNPKKLLELIARSVPEDLWFDQLQITAEKEIVIRGGAETYKSIGDFIGQANDSPFFNRSLALTDSKTQNENVGGKEFRVEMFEIKGKISVFDPWVQTQ